MKIYELKLEQQKALEELEWAEDDAEALKTLESIRGDVSKKLDFLTGLLAESIVNTHVAKEALNEAKKRLEINFKRKEKAELRLREFITSVLIDFNIKKYSGPLMNVSHYTSKGSLVFQDGFDYHTLPEGMVEIVETTVIDKKAVKDYITAGNYVEGVGVEYKETLRIS